MPGEPDLRRVECLLSEVFGSVEVTGAERCEPWFVSRVQLSGAPGSPRSVVVKWLRENSVGFRTDPAQLLTERVALEFLKGLGLEVAPRLLAADAEVLVLEDLSPRVPLWDLLAHNAPGSDDGLRSFALAMGRLHTGTIGRSEEFIERRRALGPFDPGLSVWHLDGLWEWELPDLGLVGIVATREAEAEMKVVREILTAPGPFHTFTNGDAGANNYLVEGDDGRIIDFEFAGYRHALIDAACLYMPGAMWMTVRDPAAFGVDTLYRRVLAASVREAEDDAVYGPALAAACLVRAMERLLRLAKIDDRPPGHESRAQIISTIETAARVAIANCAFPHLTSWAHTLADTLRLCWPDADREFPDAYTTRQPLTD